MRWADFVAAAAAAIRPGAPMVLDTSTTAESLLPGFREELRMTTGDIHVFATHAYDAAGSRMLTDFTFTRGGVTHRASCVHHVFTVRELVGMVTAAGFTSVGLDRDTDGRPYRVGDPRLLLTARRA